MCAIAEDLPAIDEDMMDADGQLMGFFEGGAVDDGLRVEDNHIGVVSRCQLASAFESQIRGRQRGQSANRLRERNNPLLAHILAEQARE